MPQTQAMAQLRNHTHQWRPFEMAPAMAPTVHGLATCYRYYSTRYPLPTTPGTQKNNIRHRTNTTLFCQQACTSLWCRSWHLGQSQCEHVMGLVGTDLCRSIHKFIIMACTKNSRDTNLPQAATDLRGNTCHTYMKSTYSAWAAVLIFQSWRGVQNRIRLCKTCPPSRRLPVELVVTHLFSANSSSRCRPRWILFSSPAHHGTCWQSDPWSCGGRRVHKWQDVTCQMIL